MKKTEVWAATVLYYDKKENEFLCMGMGLSKDEALGAAMEHVPTGGRIRTKQFSHSTLTMKSKSLF